MERIGRKARKESKAKEKVSGRRTVARRVAKEANLQASRQERKEKAKVEHATIAVNKGIMPGIVGHPTLQEVAEKGDDGDTKNTSNTLKSNGSQGGGVSAGYRSQAGGWSHPQAWQRWRFST